MTVPTTDIKNGDFSGLLDPNNGNALVKIYAPSNFVAPAGCGIAPGQQFPGNIIPKACMSPASLAILPLLPNPVRPGLKDNVNSQITNIATRQYNYGLSIDQVIGERQKIHGTFWRDKWNQPFCCDNGAFFSNALSGLKNEPRLGTGLVVTYSNAFTPNLMMTAGLGWIGEINDELNTSLGYKTPIITSSEIFPVVTFGGDAPFSFTNWGAGNGGETFSINRKLGVSLITTGYTLAGGIPSTSASRSGGFTRMITSANPAAAVSVSRATAPATARIPPIPETRSPASCLGRQTPLLARSPRKASCGTSTLLLTFRTISRSRRSLP